MDCIVNKTAISSRTNRIIGGAAPSKYLLTLEKRGQIDIPTMDHIMATHLIPSAALRADNFEAFFEERRQDLMDLICGAMGKAPAAAADVSEPTGDIVPANAQILLGQSFLSRFSSWSIDNNKHTLILK